MSWVLHTMMQNTSGLEFPAGLSLVPAIHNKAAAAMAPSGREEQPRPKQFLLPTAVVTRDTSKQFGTNVPLLLFQLLMLPN